jgi:hypothetical protein
MINDIWCSLEFVPPPLKILQRRHSEKSLFRSVSIFSLHSFLSFRVLGILPVTSISFVDHLILSAVSPDTFSFYSNTLFIIHLLSLVFLSPSLPSPFPFFILLFIFYFPTFFYHFSKILFEFFHLFVVLSQVSCFNSSSFVFAFDCGLCFSPILHGLILSHPPPSFFLSSSSVLFPPSYCNSIKQNYSAGKFVQRKKMTNETEQS